MLGVLVFLNVVVAFAIDSFEKVKIEVRDGKAGTLEDRQAEAQLRSAEDADHVEMQGREFSKSIQEAQRNFQVTVPAHLRSAQDLRRMVSFSVQPTSRGDADPLAAPAPAPDATPVPALVRA